MLSLDSLIFNIDGSGGIWFLIGAALVFFMQCGFAMVEAGFTRAKNAGNIIMKNLMDFCIGTVFFVILGYSLLVGQDALGNFMGKPSTLFTMDESELPNFFFNLMFCATASTIVSGAMAERTRFLSYCIYTVIISLFVYPIEAGWVWGGGWLADIGFHDFAGSTVIHMVGGLSALIGAAFLGARIGKYTRDANGKVTKVNAIPGHSLTLGALGVFILWFGWYGFNGAAATSTSQLALILVNTTIAPAVATCVTMIFTWVLNKKPDVSMCLNASLAGLVAVTASCDTVTPWAAAVIGIVAGFLVVGACNLVDQKMHIDDPVGAIGVHLANGLWGTIATALFSTTTPFDGVEGAADGLFYGGVEFFGIQMLGMVVVLAWTAVWMVATFAGIKYIPKAFGFCKDSNGLRAAAAHEVAGLDISEHGLASAYADFLPAAPVYGESAGPADLTGVKPIAVGGIAGEKYSKITVICNQDRLATLRDTMAEIGVQGMTVMPVMGCGVQKGHTAQYRGVKSAVNLMPKVQVDIVVSVVDPGLVVAAAQKALNTGHVGDGKIFVSSVEDVMRVRTGERGVAALDNEAK